MARAETLLLEALKLPPEERAEVAAELLASLDDVPVAEADEVEMAWGAEIERRARRVVAGGALGGNLAEHQGPSGQAVTKPHSSRATGTHLPQQQLVRIATLG